MNKSEFLRQAKKTYENKVKGCTHGIDWTPEMNFSFSDKLALRVWYDVANSEFMHRWCVLETLPVNEHQKVLRELARYTSNDEIEFPKIVEALKKALRETPDGMVDYVDGIEMWQKVEISFTVRDFCHLIGLTVN